MEQASRPSYTLDAMRAKKETATSSRTGILACLFPKLQLIQF